MCRCRNDTESSVTEEIGAPSAHEFPGEGDLELDGYLSGRVRRSAEAAQRRSEQSVRGTVPRTRHVRRHQEEPSRGGGVAIADHVVSAVT